MGLYPWRVYVAPPDSWYYWSRAGREGRAALGRAGGRVGQRWPRGLLKQGERPVDGHLKLRGVGGGPVVRGDQHLGVRVDAVVLHRPAELGEPGRVARDRDPGAVDEAVARPVDADHAAPGAGADHRAE